MRWDPRVEICSPVNFAFKFELEYCGVFSIFLPVRAFSGSPSIYLFFISSFIYFLQICSEFMKNMCPHNESICPFAHPPPNIIPGDDGYVTVCMDYMKSECQRICCRYFHPPPHLQARVKAAQRRPPHFFGPFMPRGIPPIMQAPSQEMVRIPLIF